MQILSPQAAADLAPVPYNRRLITDLPLDKRSVVDFHERGVYTMIDLDVWLSAGNKLTTIRQVGEVKAKTIAGLQDAWRNADHWASLRESCRAKAS